MLKPPVRIFNPHGFVAYLWGIETKFSKILSFNCFRFVAYLWGIETKKIKKKWKD